MILYVDIFSKIWFLLFNLLFFKIGLCVHSSKIYLNLLCSMECEIFFHFFLFSFL